MKEIEADPALELQLIVTGSHLSAKFGSTVEGIKKDGFKPDTLIPLDLEKDDAENIARSMATCLTEMTQSLRRLNPDILVVLGDRYEIFAAAQSTLLLNIPLAHIAGGEVTSGAMDDSIRHAITKLAHIHFAAAEIYHQRIIQLGEISHHVHMVGAVGLDNIEKLELINREQLSDKKITPADMDYFVITYHPETRPDKDLDDGIEPLIDALNQFPDYFCLFTGVNADSGGDVISTRIAKFIERRPNTSTSVKSLGQIRYLSSIKHCAAVIGNSSSGIVEAPYLKTATVNIGTRQNGRLFAPSIFSCPNNVDEISDAIKDAVKFKNTLANAQPLDLYGQPGASLKIKDILKNVSLKNIGTKIFQDQIQIR
jgi:UDP-hydrolysing UDP-N-acetyl-D-glucosamine 2-epimerase